MNRKSKPYLITSIVILIILLGMSLLYLIADKTKLNLAQLSADIAFGGTIGTLAAVSLSLIAIAYSIKKADIKIFLGDKHVFPVGTLQEIKIQNIGNDFGNMAHAFVEIQLPPSNPVSFTSDEGLTFQQTQNPDRKQYRFSDPYNPRNLYPGEYIWSLLGFIAVPSEVTGRIKFSVQIVGTQGRTRRDFEITNK